MGSEDPVELYCNHAANRFVRDIGRWAVWVGRHSPEKISGEPKGRLRRVRTPP